MDGSGDVFITVLNSNRCPQGQPGRHHHHRGRQRHPGLLRGWRAGGLGRLSQPTRVALDSSGDIFIADQNNNRVRMVPASSSTFYGQAMTAGDIYTIAGTGTSGFTSDGVAATSSELAGPGDVAVDHSGNLFIADTSNGRVRMVPAVSGTYYTQAMTAGDIYTIAGNGGGSDLTPSMPALLGSPTGLVVDGSGDVFIAEYGNPSNTSALREVAAPNGFISTLTTDSGGIFELALGGSGNIDYASGSGQVKQVGAIPTPVGLSPGGLSFSNQYVGVSSQLTTTVNNTGLSTLSISSVTVTGANSGDFVKAADTCSGANLAVGATCTITVTFTPSAFGARTASLTIADNAVGSPHQVFLIGDGAGYTSAVAGSSVAGSGDGGPALGEQMSLSGVALDGAGDMFIADSGNSRVRMVPASSGTFYGQAMTAGDIYTIAGGGTVLGDGGSALLAKLNNPSGLAVDPSGDVFIADQNNNRVRKVSPADIITTVAGNGTAGFSGDGGPAVLAELNHPSRVSLDNSGDIFIADQSNNRVRMVPASSGTFYGQAMTGGDIFTIAGNGTSGFTSDGVAATSSELAGPQDVAVDHAGNLFIADSGNSRVRMVPAVSGTYYTQAMTADDIYTIAGDGGGGDLTPSMPAVLGSPRGLVVDGSGDVFIAEYGNPSNSYGLREVAASNGFIATLLTDSGGIYQLALGSSGNIYYASGTGQIEKAVPHAPPGYGLTAGEMLGGGKNPSMVCLPCAEPNVTQWPVTPSRGTSGTPSTSCRSPAGASPLTSR